MKACPRCGETNLSKFGKNKWSKDGLQYRCRACMNASNKASYVKYREQRQAKARQYAREHHDAAVENVRRWRTRKLEAALRGINEDNPS